jgi:murein DD-endopeptidase MepM/ murein hydrolase activator NlpD
MMLKKKLTFMVIPDSSGISRELQIPVALLYGGAAFCVVLLVVSFFLAADFFGDQVSDAELAKLRAENKELTGKFEELRWDLAETDARYNELVQKEIMIRTMFDLPEINSEERQLGIGGPVPPAYTSMSDAEKVAWATEAEVDRLLRLSRFELEKYGEVEQDLEVLKDRLNHTPSIWPTKGWLSRGFGNKYDPFTGTKQFHRGLDIANNRGTPIIATAEAKVRTTGRFGGMGNMVVLDHGYGFVTRYGHLSKILVKRGQHVTRGEVIAYMGSTGYSTGPHLHYEVWRNGKVLNPHNFILNTK